MDEVALLQQFSYLMHSQRPIALKGHERAITFLKYNEDGDLLFTCAKDGRVCVWFTHNGERLGTYDGHKGAVWSLDVTGWGCKKIDGADLVQLIASVF